MPDHDHTFFILNIVNVYVSRIQAALEDAPDCCEIMECKEVTGTATSLDWKGNLLAIIADIERHIASGALPGPFEEHHCRKLAASRGYQMKEVIRSEGARGFYHLIKIPEGTFLENHTYISEDGITFTEWQAHNHLLNLSPIV